MRFVKFVSLFLFINVSVTAKVLVTTKPLFYIVAPLMNGIEMPILLKDGKGCAHHHHLRPSQVEKLKSAKLVFSEMTEKDALVEKVSKQVGIYAPFSGKSGMEILSPARVKARLDEIVALLKSHYPAHHYQLDKNVAAFLKNLIQLDSWVHEQFNTLKVRSVVTTYPFLTYFAEDYGLKVVKTLADAPFDAVKPRKLKKVYALLNSGEVIGMIKDHHIPTEVLTRVFAGNKIKVLEVDPEAIKIPLELAGYQILIENMVKSIVMWSK